MKNRFGDRIDQRWTWALAFALFPLFAHPADLNVTWTNATTYTDGSAMPASDLVSTTAWCGLSASNLTLSTTVTAPATAATVKGALAGQTYVCGAAHTSKNNGTSVMSMTGPPVVIPALKPSPPTGVGTVLAIAPTAYSVIKSQDQLVMLPVGTVPTSTACDTNQAVTLKGQTYNAVPASSVRFTGTAKPIVVFAICG